MDAIEIVQNKNFYEWSNEAGDTLLAFYSPALGQFGLKALPKPIKWFYNWVPFVSATEQIIKDNNLKPVINQ